MLNPNLRKTTEAAAADPEAAQALKHAVPRLVSLFGIETYAVVTQMGRQVSAVQKNP